MTAARPPARVLHLDTAAAGRQSLAVLDRVAAHARAESESGAYVAAGAAAAELDAARVALGGLLGVPADGVAFVEGASAGLRALLAAWPLPPGARVGVVPAEWGPNLELFAWLGLHPVPLPVDPAGALDVGALAAQFAAEPPAFVHLTQAASHRGLVHPVAEAAQICRAAGVPLWVDAAQALGHVDVATGADAVYATSRKWLAGPRGVGVVAVAPTWWERLRVLTSAMDSADLAPVRRLDSHDAHVAGRLGLGVAVRELIDEGPAQVYERYADIGRRARSVLAGLPDWRVDDGTSAVIALAPTAGQDVGAVRARLLDEHGILTTAAHPARAPRDMSGPLLRVSPFRDVTDEELHRLRAALGDLQT